MSEAHVEPIQPEMFPEAICRPEDDTDTRYTPREFIEQQHAEFRFTVDAASALDAPSSLVIGRFWSKLEDGLAQPWTGERVWCNPPWSDIEPWVKKAWDAISHEGCPLVVMLLPTWTDRDWWHRHVEPRRDRGPLWGPLLETKFQRRMAFGFPGNPEAHGVVNPNFWTVLLIFSAARPGWEGA